MLITRRIFVRSLAAASAGAFLTGCRKKARQSDLSVLRIGFFPNITHAQALIGFHETNTKGADGWFEKRTGVRVEWLAFNAGPSAVEAMLAGTIDATYVGPNPPLNGYIRTRTADIRVLTGSARGGVALVVHPDSGLKSQQDFRGKKIGTPQLGNTQDVAARAWLKAGGLKIKLTGGDAYVLPTPNPDQLNLFRTRQLDGVWTVEPWVSRLELEAEGERLIVQDDTFITLIAAGVTALQAKPELLKKLIAAHEELTAKVIAEPEFAKAAVNAGLLKATSRALPVKLLDHAWPRLKFTTEIRREDFEIAMRDAESAGLLPELADLTNFFVKL